MCRFPASFARADGKPRKQLSGCGNSNSVASSAHEHVRRHRQSRYPLRAADTHLTGDSTVLSPARASVRMSVVQLMRGDEVQRKSRDLHTTAVILPQARHETQVHRPFFGACTPDRGGTSLFWVARRSLRVMVRQEELSPIYLHGCTPIYADTGG